MAGPTVAVARSSHRQASPAAQPCDFRAICRPQHYASAFTYAEGLIATAAAIAAWSTLPCAPLPPYLQARMCVVRVNALAQRVEYIWHDGAEGTIEKVGASLRDRFTAAAMHPTHSRGMLHGCMSHACSAGSPGSADTAILCGATAASSTAAASHC